jgi:hypothetical protein
VPSRFSAIVRSDLDQVQDMLESRQRELTGAPRPARREPPPAALCEPIKVTGISIDPEIQIQHVQNFLDCIRSRKRPVADVEIGHRSIIPCHLGNISYRTGRKILWDAQKERIVADAEASAWLSKKYREPWTLPRV